MNTATHSNKAMKGQDLGPLAWVLAEMRQTYGQAIESLQGFASRVSDPEQTSLSDDTSEIAKAKNLIHQTCGALEMVGAFIPAFVLRQCEHVVSVMAQRPQTCTPQAVATLAQTGSVVGEYLESLLQDPALSPVLLFPAYKNAHALTGMQPPASPADLWHLEGDLREPELPLPNKAILPNARVRALLDRSILHLMQGKAVERSGKDLVKLCLGLAAGNQDFRERTFWKVAAGFFEGLAQQRIPNDLYVKRAATRVLVQYASLDKGDIHITARWMQDLLFFCSQARDVTPASSPVLTAVRTAFGLERTPIVDYETNVFNRLREADRKALLEDLKAAAESWGSIVEGHVENAASTAAQLHHTGAVLVRHFPETAPLIQTLKQIIDTLAKKHAKPPTELAMEVATTILYLQAMLEDIRTRTAQLSERMGELNKRLRTVAEHGESLPLPEWMEELYTRVRDSETITSVVGELRASLTEVENHIDRFFRNHADIDALRDAPSILLRVRGVLAVLGMVPATKAITQINLDIQEIIQQHEQGELNETDGRFEKIGNNLGALGLQVDMLAYQPSLARELFVFDGKTSQLQPLMGRLKVYEIGGRDIFEHVQEAAVTPVDPDPRYADNGETTPMVFDPTTPMPLPEAPSAQPEAQALTQDLIFTEDAADTQDEAAEAEKPEQEAPAALEEEKEAPLVTNDAALAPQPKSAALTDEGELLDEELLEIFLEEAREVIGNGRDALTHLAQSPGDVPQQTILRRAFHTLKGSSRMVGLAAFGEAAWAMEQLMNSWLAEQKAFHPPIHDLCQESLNALQEWVDAIAAHAPVAWQPEAFQQSAEAMRTQDRYVPLQAPAENAPAFETPQAMQPGDASKGVPGDSPTPDVPDATLSEEEQAVEDETGTLPPVLDEASDVQDLGATSAQAAEETPEPEALGTAQEVTAHKEAETIALDEDVTVEDEDEDLADIEFSHSDLVRFSELDQAHEGLPTDFSSVLIEPLEAHAPATDQSQPLSQDWKELDFLAADQQESPPANEETPKDLIATESLLGEIDDNIRSSIMGSLPSKDEAPAVAQAQPEPSPPPSHEVEESDFLHSSLFDRDSDLEKTRVMEDDELYDDLMGEKTRVMETAAVLSPDDSLLMGLQSLPELEFPSLASAQPAAPAQETAPQPDVAQPALEP
ncbi:MAG: Hpt domain-containing protein, partial [Comamonadaceae bacterium]|nr:Hpt domain-containing protein [Comamonadaceae bacterium]